MGRQGRVRVERHFTLEKTVRDVEAIYRRVLGLQPISRVPEQKDELVPAALATERV